MKVDRKSYWWKKFKMTWLVPNYGRARGPAWWIYSVMYWWHWNMTMDFTNSFLHRSYDWWRRTAMLHLTPWLASARCLMRHCTMENGTKLLDYSALSSWVRTRDENQFYFTMRISLLGRLRIWRSQWTTPDGRPCNLFMHCFMGEEPLQEKRELVFDSRVLTRRQMFEARRKMLGIRELAWEATGE